MRIIYTAEASRATNAATSLARKIGCSTVTELVDVLYPEQAVSAKEFNVCSDAIHALKEDK
jgi:hypothetical protein